ncbi:hypothetical protein F4604DRAFT_1944560 [Suillus subluteus]|nr:hypothetical protein F4604DRAFT_1944560 [Suillus subluteus]
MTQAQFNGCQASAGSLFKLDAWLPLSNLFYYVESSTQAIIHIVIPLVFSFLVFGPSRTAKIDYKLWWAR